MSQTLLAVAALAIVMVVGLSVHRHRAGLEERRVGSEIDTVALGVATERLNRASLLPFDAVERVLDVAALTPPSAFGTAASWAAAGDLDDLDGLEEAVEVTSHGSTLVYTVRATVRYVRLEGVGFVEADAQTPYKELTVEVEGPDGRRAVLSRVFGCRFNA